MKIKVIDLLNMIAKGEEVPEIIYEEKTKYKYDKDEKDYFTGMGYDYEYFFKNMKTIWLNDEVEIIEDKPQMKVSKKIEKIGMHFSFGYIDTDNRKLVFSELDKNLNLFGDKIDEIIDKINEMSKND